MKQFDCEQKSETWWRLRAGVPTSSQFERVIQPVKLGPSTSQDNYIDQLICETIDYSYAGDPEEVGFVSKSMENGTICEPVARSWYCFDRDCDVQEIGFCMSDDGRFGCSPDGLIGDEGMLEIKCPDLRTHVRYLRDGVLPSKYKPQVHGSLIVTGREWCDFVSYSASDELDNLVVRVYPDKFTQALREELDRFWVKYQTALEKLGRHIQRPIDTVLPVAEV